MENLNKYVESKLKKGIKLNSDFLEKINVTSTKNKDAKINLDFIKAVREKHAKYKNSFMQSSKENKILIKENSFEEDKVDKANEMTEIQFNPNLTQTTNNVVLSRSDRRKSLVKSRESFLSNPQQPKSTTSPKPKFPMTAAQALKYFMNEMNDHEAAEILDYKTVYYIGQNWEKIKGSILKTPNYGYDDEQGDYKVIINDHIAYRYQIIDFLGKGSFGQALKWFDNKENRFVWLKIIKNKKRFFRQGLIEVKILKYLKDHENSSMHSSIIMEDSFIFRKHLWIIFELLSINLYEFLKK